MDVSDDRSEGTKEENARVSNGGGGSPHWENGIGEEQDDTREENGDITDSPQAEETPTLVLPGVTTDAPGAALDDGVFPTNGTSEKATGGETQQRRKKSAPRKRRKELEDLLAVSFGKTPVRSSRKTFSSIIAGYTEVVEEETRRMEKEQEEKSKMKLRTINRQRGIQRLKRLRMKGPNNTMLHFDRGLVQGETRLIHFKKDLTAAIRVEATSKVEKKLKKEKKAVKKKLEKARLHKKLKEAGKSEKKRKGSEVNRKEKIEKQKVMEKRKQQKRMEKLQAKKAEEDRKRKELRESRMKLEPCPICELEFRVSLLQRHVIECMKRKEQEEARLARASVRRSAELTVTAEASDDRRCPICGDSVPLKASMQVHIDACISGGKSCRSKRQKKVSEPKESTPPPSSHANMRPDTISKVSSKKNHAERKRRRVMVEEEDEGENLGKAPVKSRKKEQQMFSLEMQTKADHEKARSERTELCNYKPTSAGNKSHADSEPQRERKIDPRVARSLERLRQEELKDISVTQSSGRDTNALPQYPNECVGDSIANKKRNHQELEAEKELKEKERRVPHDGTGNGKPKQSANEKEKGRDNCLEIGSEQGASWLSNAREGSSSPKHPRLSDQPALFHLPKEDTAKAMAAERRLARREEREEREEGDRQRHFQGNNRDSTSDKRQSDRIEYDGNRKDREDRQVKAKLNSERDSTSTEHPVDQREEGGRIHYDLVKRGSSGELRDQYRRSDESLVNDGCHSRRRDTSSNYGRQGDKRSRSSDKEVRNPAKHRRVEGRDYRREDRRDGRRNESRDDLRDSRRKDWRDDRRDHWRDDWRNDRRSDGRDDVRDNWRRGRPQCRREDSRDCSQLKRSRIDADCPRHNEERNSERNSEKDPGAPIESNTETESIFLELEKIAQEEEKKIRQQKEREQAKQEEQLRRVRQMAIAKARAVQSPLQSTIAARRMPLSAKKPAAGGMWKKISNDAPRGRGRGEDGSGRQVRRKTLI